MSHNSEVLGKISVEHRIPGDENATWLIETTNRLTDKQKQSLFNFAGTVGGVVSIKHHKQNVYMITVLKTTAEHEAERVQEVVKRFIRVVDGNERQRRETPLAEHSTVPVYGHHEQG